MRNKLLILLLSSLSFSIVTSCSDSPDEDEMNVINNDLAMIVYCKNIDRRAESCSEYLADGIKQYSETAHSQTQDKIDDRNATAALFGGNTFDIGELYGTSTNQLIAKRYYRYIDYVNDHSDTADEDLEEITKIVKKNPGIIDSFFNSNSDISLNAFSSIQGMPASISSAQFEYYRKIELNKENAETWGKLVMGTLENPMYSPRALLCALIIRFERLKYPVPEYIVEKEYDDEFGWEVGYNTGQAYFVTFNQDEDILEYDYTPVDYYERYIDSKKNVLKKNVK